MHGTVLEDKCEDEHDDSKSPIYDFGRDFLVAEAFPETLQEKHRPAVYEPEREDAADGIVGGKLPC